MRFSLLLCLATLLAPTQTAPLVTGPRSDSKATVYVYKTPHAKTFGRITFPVILDEKRIAKLDGNRFFVLLLEPGLHIFRSSDKKAGGVEIEMKAGQAYYLRLVTSSDIIVGSPHFTLEQPESGSYTVKQQKPIKEGDLLDSSNIVMELVQRKK